MGLMKIIANHISALPATDFQFNEMQVGLARGLAGKQARIAPKYFYNPLGSKLFEAICQLDEYYLIVKGETIHTENSSKYTKANFLQLLEQAGFGAAQRWTDEQNSFLVCYVQAV